MPRMTRPALTIAALLVIAGCTTATPGNPATDAVSAPTDSPDSDAVAWVDSMCEAVLTFARTATAPPDFAATQDLPAVQRLLSDHLGSLVTSAQQSRTQLDAIGQPPVPGGDEAVDRTRGTLQNLEQDVAAAKATVDTADPDDPEAFLAVVDQVESTIAEITTPDPLAALRTTPQLRNAAELATQCRQLSALSGAIPR